MKAKLSILVEDLRGKAGNVVGKQSQSGQIMMVRSIGRDPKSQTQIKSRLLLTVLSKKWAALTQAQRDQWNTYAGTTRSGYDLYCERNTNLNSIGQPFISDYVVPGTITAQFNVQFNINPEQRLFNVTINVSTTDDKTSLLIKISQFTKRKLSNPTYKYRNVFSTVISGTKTVNIYDDILRINGRAPMPDSYFRIELSEIERASGYKILFSNLPLQWTAEIQPYEPTVTFTEGSFKASFSSSSDSGEIEGLANITNFNFSRIDSIETGYVIYNDQAGQNIFFNGDIYQPADKTAKQEFYFYPDGGAFSETWSKGVTKYIALTMRITTNPNSEAYAFKSQLHAVTAS